MDVVQAYMNHIQQAAEGSVRQLLKSTALKFGNRLTAYDFLDDGTRINLVVDIHPDFSATFDFSGTGHEGLSMIIKSMETPTRRLQ